MSKLFYDHLINFEELEREVRAIAQTSEEKEELWKIVDETIHHRALGCVLDALPREHHEEFLQKFHKAPYDTNLITYLKEKIGQNIEELLRQELGNLSYEILTELKFKKT